MLIVEKNKEFTESGSAVSPYHEYVIYITESNFWFLSIFLRASLSKCFMKMLAITGEIGDSITDSEVCS